MTLIKQTLLKLEYVKLLRDIDVSPTWHVIQWNWYVFPFIFGDQLAGKIRSLCWSQMLQWNSRENDENYDDDDDVKEHEKKKGDVKVIVDNSFDFFGWYIELDLFQFSLLIDSLCWVFLICYFELYSLGDH